MSSKGQRFEGRNSKKSRTSSILPWRAYRVRVFRPKARGLRNIATQRKPKALLLIDALGVQRFVLKWLCIIYGIEDLLQETK